MHISGTVLDELMEDCRAGSDLFGKEGLVVTLSKCLIERILELEKGLVGGAEFYNVIH